MTLARARFLAFALVAFGAAACGGGGYTAPISNPTTNPGGGPSSSPSASPSGSPTPSPTASPSSSPTSSPSGSPAPTPTPSPTPLIVHIGFQFGEFTDPVYGPVNFYSPFSSGTAQVVKVASGSPVQFENDDQFSTTHTASGLGTSFPKQFDNKSGQTQAGSILDGSLTWSTGALTPGSRSQVLTVGPPGTYYFGCFFHYSVPPTKNNGSMGDVLVSM